MITIWSAVGFIVIYLGILFFIATAANAYFNKRPNKLPPSYIYALAMGIHCTSWAFFGTTTQAVQFGWSFVPTYLGVIIAMLVGYPLLRKIATLCQEHKIASLAEFLSMRYRQSSTLSVLITLLCIIGVIPYIALQLDAITMILALFSTNTDVVSFQFGAYVSLLTGVFVILFGARQLDLTQKHIGLMYTLAFSSMIKVVCLTIIGFYITFSVFNGVWDMLENALSNPTTRSILYSESSAWVYLTHIILGIASMFCLPRQFHVNFVEYNNENELKCARWLMPLYLIMMTIFILPIAIAGTLLFEPGTVHSDSFALSIPMHQNNILGVISAVIGGIAAASSMIIVATLALGIMISNNLITPAWFWFKRSALEQQSLQTKDLLLIRQGSIVFIIAIAYLYHVNISQTATLVKTGAVAMSLLAQSFPAIIAAVYWRKASLIGVNLGLAAGITCWIYWLLYPTILAGFYFEPSPTDLELAKGFTISICINILIFVGFSLYAPETKFGIFSSFVRPNKQVKLKRLLDILQRLIPNHSLTKQINTVYQSTADNNESVANNIQLRETQNVLAAHIGNASAKILLGSIYSEDSANDTPASEWVEIASQSFKFNRDLLESSVNYLPQGIRVIDADFNLIA